VLPPNGKPALHYVSCYVRPNVFTRNMHLLVHAYAAGWRGLLHITSFLEPKRETLQCLCQTADVLCSWSTQNRRCSAGMLAAAAGAMPFLPVAASSWQAGINRTLSSLGHLTQLKHLQLRFICGERGTCGFYVEMSDTVCLCCGKCVRVHLCFPRWRVGVMSCTKFGCGCLVCAREPKSR
jgi:hypothetical protein